MYYYIRFIVFLVCFALSLWACSSIQFDKICKVSPPSKVILLLFLMALIMGYLASEAILQLTILNGLGG